MPTARLPVLLVILSIIGFGITALLAPSVNATEDISQVTTQEI